MALKSVFFMYSEIFYFLVFVNLAVFVWGALSRNRILLFLGIVFTFLFSLVLSGTGIDYYTGHQEITYDVSGDVNGTEPIFLNVSPANDKGLGAFNFVVSLVSFMMIPISGFFWLYRPLFVKDERGRR